MKKLQSWSRGLAAGATILSLALGTPVVRALPTIRSESKLTLEFDVILVPRAGEGRTVAERSLTLDSSEPASASIPLAWPEADAEAVLTITATGRPGIDEEGHAVTAKSALKLPGKPPVVADWKLRIREGTSRIVEAYAEGRVRVLLALRAEETTRPVVGISSKTARQVRFGLEIHRVEGESTTLLETNLLDSFVGEPVEYSFERGDEDHLETMRISLRPSRLDGDIVEVELEIDGTLPGTPSRVVVSRRERLLTTRGLSSSVTISAGDPAAGYRFVVRPDW